MTKTKAQGRSLPTTSQPDIIKIWIPGVCIPKARARVTRNGTYLPQRYREWRQMAESSILVLLSSGEKASLPISRAEVRITLQGKHRGDLDNLAGSVLDSLVSANVLLDDRLTCVPRLVVEHELEGTCGVSVELKVLSPNFS